MITRRALISTGTAGLLAGVSRRAIAAPPSPNDPVAIINAIYTRAAKGKGNGGGGFIIENKAAKAKYLSKSLVELWARGRCAHAERRRRTDRFRSRHQFAGART